MAIYDCFQFFNEEHIVDLRINILNEYVDFFVISESTCDHQGKPKKLNFNLNKFNKFKDKIIYIVVDDTLDSIKKPHLGGESLVEQHQRNSITKGLKNCHEEDLIILSDVDEIPDLTKLNQFNKKNKYFVFSQKAFAYKLNLFNPYETPWEGTRISKKKDLKSIDWLRQKVLVKNLKYPFWRLDKEKSIQIIQNGGWHFNYLHTPEEISHKLNTFAHSQWSNKEFTEINTIKNKILNNEDLFKRGHRYHVLKNLDYLPDYIKENFNFWSKFFNFILCHFLPLTPSLSSKIFLILPI